MNPRQAIESALRSSLSRGIPPAMLRAWLARQALLQHPRTIQLIERALSAVERQKRGTKQ